MDAFNEKDFRISGQIVNKKEKEFLKSFGHKYCAKCKSAKKEVEFYKSQHSCIPCSKTKKGQWIDKNPSYFQDYRDSHKEQQKRSHADWLLRNKEKKNAQNREWYYNNKEKKMAQNKKWRKEKSITNPSFRIAKNLRQRVSRVVKKVYKSAPTLSLLGCSLEELTKHFESLFTEGMSWDNYGNPNGDHSNSWHIDHIKPCSLFDLTQEEEQRKCFHYSNLQPLWGIDNMKKSNKFV